MREQSCIIHWIHQADDGPIVSGGLGQLVPPGGRFVIACMPARNTVGGLNASDETFLVNCPACKKVPLYREKYRPHPRVATEMIAEETRKALGDLTE